VGVIDQFYTLLNTVLGSGMNPTAARPMPKKGAGVPMNHRYTISFKSFTLETSLAVDPVDGIREPVAHLAAGGVSVDFISLPEGAAPVLRPNSSANSFKVTTSDKPDLGCVS